MSGHSIRFVCAFIFAASLLSSCVEFKKMSLYNGEEVSAPLVRPDNINQLVEPTIFDDDFTDVWGIEETTCKSATVSNAVVASGQQAIKVEWDRNAKDCIWAGFGIGWDSYSGKDLSELIPYAAIQFQVRTVEGRMFGLPVVLTLEDYSGGMGFSYTGNKYFERSYINEEWQKVTVPLSSFDMKVENLDPTNIKQIMFELQQGGSLYFDDIKLVMYEAPVIEPWHVEEERPDPTAFPITLFDDSFINDNGWGLMKDECRDIQIVDETIHASWDDQKDCGAIQMGISWNKWFPVDMSNINKGTQLQLSLKPMSPSTSGTVLVQFQDYSGILSKGHEIELSGLPDAFNTNNIPVSKLLEGVDVTNVKQVFFTFQGKGKVRMDDIKLVVLTP